MKLLTVPTVNPVNTKQSNQCLYVRDCYKYITVHSSFKKNACPDEMLPAHLTIIFSSFFYNACSCACNFEKLYIIAGSQFVHCKAPLQLQLTANLESIFAPAPIPKPMKLFTLKTQYNAYNHSKQIQMMVTWILSRVLIRVVLCYHLISA